MSGVLDEFPLDFSRPQLRALHGVIARTIYQPNDVQAVVIDSGMNPATVNFTGNSAVQW